MKTSCFTSTKCNKLSWCILYQGLWNTVNRNKRKVLKWKLHPQIRFFSFQFTSKLAWKKGLTKNCLLFFHFLISSWEEANHMTNLLWLQSLYMSEDRKDEGKKMRNWLRECGNRRAGEDSVKAEGRDVCVDD